MVDLAHHLKCPHALPSNVSIAVVHKETIGTTTKTKTVVHKITEDESDNVGVGNVSHNFMSMSSLQ